MEKSPHTLKADSYLQVLPTEANAETTRKILQEKGVVSIRIASRSTLYHVHFIDLAYSTEDILLQGEENVGFQSSHFQDGSNLGLCISIDRKKSYSFPRTVTKASTVSLYYEEKLGIGITEELCTFFNIVRVK